MRDRECALNISRQILCSTEFHMTWNPNFNSLPSHDDASHAEENEQHILVSTAEEVDYEFEEEYYIERDESLEVNGVAENLPLIFVAGIEEDQQIEIPEGSILQILSPHQGETSPESLRFTSERDLPEEDRPSTNVQRENVDRGHPVQGACADSWRPGDRLTQIYLNDEEVPTELKARMMKVHERRLERQRAIGRRNARLRAARNDDDQDYQNEHDLDEGGDAALFPGDADALHFDWRPMDTYRGERETFLPQQTGPTTPAASPYEAFIQYWDKPIMAHIVKETNSYAAAHTEWTGWYDTNIHEIFTLFAFWIMTGIIRMTSMRACFSGNPLLYTSCFRSMFTRVRYEKLCKDNSDSSLPHTLTKSTATVIKLIRPLLNKGYTLFMDNWFNSPLLARFLKKNKTDVVGSLRQIRQHVPELIVQCELQPGQFVARHSGDMTVMAYHDRKKICLISTYHGDEVSLSPPKPYRRQAYKPKLVLDYNKGMGGVDLKDGMLE
ncbi:transposase IS4 domain-containing protein [Phthorimaea operculella]|nr:transposase IS4 domain-containing protein [Phthorimaea operculella]